jgi:hypothetical protein
VAAILPVAVFVPIPAEHLEAEHVVGLPAVAVNVAFGHMAHPSIFVLFPPVTGVLANEPAGHSESVHAVYEPGASLVPFHVPVLHSLQPPSDPDPAGQICILNAIMLMIKKSVCVIV